MSANVYFSVESLNIIHRHDTILYESKKGCCTKSKVLSYLPVLFFDIMIYINRLAVSLPLSCNNVSLY